MILGLDAPTSGAATVNGKPYREHTRPAARGRRPAGGPLGPPRPQRLPPPAGRRADQRHPPVAGSTRSSTRWACARPPAAGPGSFSLGMGQRLAIATALLGDPRTVILDEPLNGLDTEGIRWVRSLLRSLAAEGRTVFVSSHLMNEMSVTAEHLIVIGRGRLIADTSIADFIARASRSTVRVRATDPDALAAVLRGPDVTVSAGRRRRADRRRAEHRPGRHRRPGRRDHRARARHPAGLARGGLHRP